LYSSEFNRCDYILGREIQLTFENGLAAEIDGEPFMLEPCEMKITRKNQTRMIMNARSEAAKQT
jgi:diacylglycerol kinase family enzyme